jgi:hypothetical protein
VCVCVCVCVCVRVCDGNEEMHFLLITELQIFVVVKHDKKTSGDNPIKETLPRQGLKLLTVYYISNYYYYETVRN